MVKFWIVFLFFFPTMTREKRAERKFLAGSVECVGFCGSSAEFVRHHAEHVLELGVTILGRHETALAAPQELDLELGPEEGKIVIYYFYTKNILK